MDASNLHYYVIANGMYYVCKICCAQIWCGYNKWKHVLPLHLCGCPLHIHDKINNYADKIISPSQHSELTALNMYRPKDCEFVQHYGYCICIIKQFAFILYNH